MTTTDDERREVAERLRRSWPSVADENPVNRALRFYLAVNSAIFDPREYDEKDTIDMLDRLADLVEPSESKVKCVAEVKVDGERLEKLAHDAVVELTGIDRDALLALAEECDEMRDNGCSIGSYEVYRIARRIREACGEVVG